MTVVFTLVVNSCWCHSPISTLSLCLLAQVYDHACEVLTKCGQLEASVGFLVEVGCDVVSTSLRHHESTCYDVVGRQTDSTAGVAYVYVFTAAALRAALVLSSRQVFVRSSHVTASGQSLNTSITENDDYLFALELIHSMFRVQPIQL